MPELPEIEVIRRDLEKEVVGRRIKDVNVRPGTNAMKIIKRHGRRKEFQDLLVGGKVEAIDRAGKLILVTLDNDHVLTVDLGESGQLLKTSASDDLAVHTHIVVSFTIGGQLRFVDPKKTSEVYIAPAAEIEEVRTSLGYSIDPFEHPVAWQHFSGMLEDQETPMKKLLLDEKFIVGLGDIYSDEILFGSGIKFDRASNKLSSQDVRRLYRALMEILQDALKARGTSYGDGAFTDLQGIPGQYQLELKVFEREGEPCRRCRSTIERGSSGGVSSYFCPQCQS